MTPTWFNTPGRILALDLEAQSWLGTPFFPNSQSKGRGVSCQKLAAAIYEAVGFAQLDVPEVPMSWARSNRDSLVLRFLDGHPVFEQVVDGLVPGDLLGFRINRTVHHVGIALDGRRFVHCVDLAGVQITTLEDATWGGRLAAVWRPRP